MPPPKGGYFLKDGTRIPSTTTVIGRFKESGGLLFWAFERGKAGAVSLYEERQGAADIGTVAHLMVEGHIQGLPEREWNAQECTVEQFETARGAYRAYLTWERQSQLKIVGTEIPLVCECHRFGGTPDAIGEIDGELCLLDWKTSNGLYVDMLIQLAAYRHLWEVNHPDGLLTGGFHLCRFAKEHGDFAHHHFPALKEAWQAFVLMRELYDLDKSLKKRVA